MKNNPHPFFGHLFQSDGNFYYYEATSQEIIALDPIMAVVLPHFEQCREGDIPSCVRTFFQPGEVRAAVEAIEQAINSDDLFSRQRPQLVAALTPIKPDEPYATDLQHLVLTLTENCNLRCRYCMHGASLDWVRSHGHQSMTTATALQATRYFLERCCTDENPTISFYGGEALLQVGLIEAVIAEVRDHPLGSKARLVIDTNGVLLDEAAITLVVENKMYLQVSLDGPRLYHDRQRPDKQGKGTFDRIMKALGRLLELDPTAYKRLSFMSTVAPPVDLMELDEFFGSFPLYEKFGIKTDPVVRVNLANLNGQDWPATPEDFDDMGEQIFRMRERYFQEVAAGRHESLGPVVKSLVEPSLFLLHHRSKASISETFIPGGNCRPGIKKLHVTVDGRFQPCERTGEMLELGHVQGGVDTAAVGKLQEGFFKAVQGNCADCWALRLCGVCYAGWAECGGGTSRGAALPESVCRTIRGRIEEDMKLLVRLLELPAGCREYLDQVVIV